MLNETKTRCGKGHLLIGNVRVCKQCAREYRRRRQKKLATLRGTRKTPKGVLPPKHELSNLMEQHTWVAIGLHYGVSDVAVRKWAKSYGLI